MLKNKILTVFEENRDKTVSGGELSRRFETSRTAVWKAVKSLRDEGYEIESLKNSGYKFKSANDVLSEIQIRKNLNTKILGSKVEVLKSIDSTNLYMKRNSDFYCEGTVVVANEQTHGRGRMNRIFHSPGGEGIYMSFLLKPDIAPDKIQFITICTAVGICLALENICGIHADIKWVNDILYENKKLCGILTEAVISAEAQTVQSVIVGIGLNTGVIAEQVEGIASSIQKITGKKICRNKLITEILTRLEEIYINFLKKSEKKYVLDEYTKRLSVLGREVTINNSDTESVVVVTGIDESGALIVKNKNGETAYLKSGEINFV